ncbi:class I SAM-dependent methyltransferase [Idiomarina seosinensis]|uniref:class I SAM-dependent methyltransferase n=1 Tax=Idiomarina seosinensis TaxID=281739 RepID=UPI00384D10D3
MSNKQNPWSVFWQKGAFASFLDKSSTLQNYQMRKFWFERMDELEPKQPILDIGTGNGIVPQWLAEYAAEKGKDFTVIGIDAAQINPTNSELTLHGETPYETFTLSGNKKFGTLVSNFGLEYGDLEQGLAHLHKNLKRGGALVALMHSEDSVIVQSSRKVYELLPSTIKQMNKAVEPLYKALLSANGQALPKSAQQAQQKLNQFANKHRNDPTFQRTNFVPAVKHILSAAEQGKQQEAEKVFTDYLGNLTDHRARLSTLVKAVEQVGDQQQLQQQVEAAGFKKVSVQQVQFPETGVVGLCLQAVK